jgi:hypothetical protein
MPDRKAPHSAEFAVLLMKGLAWGAVTAIALMLGGLLFADMSSAKPTNGAIYLIVVFYAVVAMPFLAFILGPIAALFAWPIYRRGIRAPSAYAIAGAAAAASLPLGFKIVDGSLFRPDWTEGEFLFIAWFAFSGAFGGFMAARALHQNVG